FPSVVDNVGGETAGVTGDADTSVSDQALDGQIKDGKTNAESDPSQASSAVGNHDQHRQNVLKESKDTAADNSYDAVKSGDVKAKETNKGKKNNSKKRKGRKGGKK
ncbi:hypothetical protein KIW84_072200, partial [Lathyrus oleraceus]